MCIARKGAYADVFDGKIYLRGGCSKKYRFTEVWGEIYDPKTQTWELLKGLSFHMSVSRLVRANLTLAQSLYYYGLKRGKNMNICVFQVIENKEWCKARVDNYGTLLFSDLSPTSYTRVAGLEEISSNHLIAVANSSRGGRRVTVWWKDVNFCGVCRDLFGETNRRNYMGSRGMGSECVYLTRT